MNEVAGRGLYLGPRQHHRCNKTVYGNASLTTVRHRHALMQLVVQPSNQHGLKAQGKAIMFTVLTRSLLRTVYGNASLTTVRHRHALMQLVVQPSNQHGLKAQGKAIMFTVLTRSLLRIVRCQCRNSKAQCCSDGKSDAHKETSQRKSPCGIRYRCKS